MKKTTGFTLVELIVVIVILSILATIAFISFGSQSSLARDSTRLADIANIAKGLGVYNASTSKYPMPDNPVSIIASGNTIGYQGNIGSSIFSIIKLSNGGRDPLDSSLYTYSVNFNQNKFQVLGFLEDKINSGISFVPEFNKYDTRIVSADLASYNGRTAFTKGDQVGILLNSGTYVPIQVNAGTGIEVANTNTGYIIKFTNEASFIGTGAVLFSNIYNRSTELQKDKSMAQYDKSLIGYWDMESLSGGSLRDWSSYNNTGICMEAGSDLTACGTNLGGPQFVSSDGRSGKAMNFDGMNDIVKIPYNSSFNLNDMTLFVKMKHSGTGEANLGGGWRILSSQDGISKNLYFMRINDSFKADLVSPLNRGDLIFQMASLTSSQTYYTGGVVVNITDPNFHYLANTKGSKVTEYIDGVKHSEYNNNVGVINTGDALYIGGYRPDNELYAGIIDEVRVYNRVLSEAEIQALTISVK